MDGVPQESGSKSPSHPAAEPPSPAEPASTEPAPPEPAPTKPSPAHPPAVNVEIAICTWNRARQLAQTLASIAKLDVSRQVQLRVIIVDNHSTDSTPSVIQDFCRSDFARHHEVLALHESRQGHTYSRNRAVDAAAGDLMIWTDDDVIVAPDWVAKYVAAADNQDVTFWGSQIDPTFEGGCPTWVSENWDLLKGCFAARDLGQEAIALTESRLPYGANFAIRTDIQKQFAFDCGLGRRGEQVVGEDELDLFRRLLKSGYQGSWVPGSVVQHMIPIERATEKYVFDYFVGQGRAIASKGEPWYPDQKRMAREARRESFKYKTKRLFAASPVWVSHLIRSGLAQGQAEVLKAEDRETCD